MNKIDMYSNDITTYYLTIKNITPDHKETVDANLRIIADKVDKINLDIKLSTKKAGLNNNNNEIEKIKLTLLNSKLDTVSLCKLIHQSLNAIKEGRFQQKYAAIWFNIFIHRGDFQTSGCLDKEEPLILSFIMKIFMQSRIKDLCSKFNKYLITYPVYKSSNITTHGFNKIISSIFQHYSTLQNIPLIKWKELGIDFNALKPSILRWESASPYDLFTESFASHNVSSIFVFIHQAYAVKKTGGYLYPKLFPALDNSNSHFKFIEFIFKAQEIKKLEILSKSLEINHLPEPLNYQKDMIEPFIEFIKLNPDQLNNTYVTSPSEVAQTPLDFALELGLQEVAAVIKANGGLTSKELQTLKN